MSQLKHITCFEAVQFWIVGGFVVLILFLALFFQGCSRPFERCPEGQVLVGGTGCFTPGMSYTDVSGMGRIPGMKK